MPGPVSLGGMAIPVSPLLTSRQVEPYLRECGYSANLLRRDFRFGSDKHVGLAAFAHLPLDIRTACIAVVDVREKPDEAVAACRELGAPIVFACHKNELQWWRQGPKGAIRVESVPAAGVGRFFDTHREDFAPAKVYRAKTCGAFDKHYQLSFVDVGLMSVVESQIGEKLAKLIERSVSTLKRRLGWRRLSASKSDWLLKSVFWLLAAKILRDKGVPGFSAIVLHDVDDTFRRVARHYGAASRVAVNSQRERDALEEVARSINRFADLGHTTTESLAYVYENALVSKAARKELAIHSTPPYLVEYVVRRLASWIEEIPQDERNVFEPACGHAAFLVSAMRLLSEFLPEDWNPRQRHSYFHQRLHGSEIDAFALEIARLSLTLADIPNPDGWDLIDADMFQGETLTRHSRFATVFLANPPFENVKPTEREEYSRRGVRFRYPNKTAEMLGRVLPVLPAGAVIGVVVPQGLLHSRQAAGVREILVHQFDISEICLFPDKMFTFSDMESAVLLARKERRRAPKRSPISYRQVRERDVERFKMDYYFSSIFPVDQPRFDAKGTFTMRVPDLAHLWSWCCGMSALESIARIGQGFFFKGTKDLPRDAVTFQKRPFRGGHEGFVRWQRDLGIHELPRVVCVNVDPSVIDRMVTGAVVGRPQVLLNYAPVSRGPWRLKALLDRQGHPVTSRFLTIRPRDPRFSLEFLWALCNSPFANGYAYTHLGKRDNLVGVLRRMPVPRASDTDMAVITDLARSYCAAVTGGLPESQGDYEPARKLLLQLDAEILRLYDLPPRYERGLLDLFSGWQRQGVPFEFDRYYPEDYEPCFPLHEYISESYQRSTAGFLRTQPRDEVPQELLRALRAATEAFADEE